MNPRVALQSDGVIVAVPVVSGSPWSFRPEASPDTVHGDGSRLSNLDSGRVLISSVVQSGNECADG